jgi:hypothetical protein
MLRHAPAEPPITQSPRERETIFRLLRSREDYTEPLGHPGAHSAGREEDNKED